VPLRIAFDLDGVLADMDGGLGRLAERLFGSADAPTPAPPGGDAPGARTPSGPAEGAGEAEEEGLPLPALHLTARQRHRLWSHVSTLQNFWETLDEIEPGAVARLALIAADKRWEVIFLTRRPESAGATAQVQTQRWLASKGFCFPAVFVVHESRGRIARALGLDFVVDDRPENCLDVVADSKARAILVWRMNGTTPPAMAKRLGIGVVGTVAECLDILTQVDVPRDRKASLIDRVLRTLGLTPNA
jgi:hypothetical protein